MPRMVPHSQRRKIEEISRKRYGGNNRQRKRYEVRSFKSSVSIFVWY